MTKKLSIIIFFAGSFLVIPHTLTTGTLDSAIPIRTALLGILLAIQFLLFLESDIRELGKLKLPAVFSSVFLLFILLSIVSTIFSRNPALGIQPIVKHGLMLCYFVAASKILTFSQNPFQLYFKSLIIFVLIQSPIAILHVYHFGFKFIQYSYNGAVGTMTNVNILSSAIALAFPSLIYGLIKLPKIWKVLSGISILFSLFIFYSSGTRSVYVSFLVSTVFILALFIFTKWKVFGKGKRLILLISGGLLLLVFTFLIHDSQRWKYLDTNPISWNNAGLQLRDAEQNNSVRSRLLVWSKTSEIIAENSIIGVGSGNWQIEILKKGIVSNNDKGDFGVNFFKRPHNEYLLIFSEGGAGSFLCYLLIILIPVIAGIKALKNSKEIGIPFVFIGTITLFLVISFFAFPYERIFHSLIFIFSISALLHFLKPNVSIRPKNTSRLFLIFMVVSLLSVVFSFQEIRNQYYWKKIIATKARKDWHNLLKYTSEIAPDRTHFNPAYAIPLSWYKGLAYNELNDPQASLQAFINAQKATPYNPHVMYSLGAAYYQTGNFKESKRIYKKTLIIYPDFVEARLNLAATYFELGEIQLAKKTLLSCDSQKDTEVYQQLSKRLFNY